MQYQQGAQAAYSGSLQLLLFLFPFSSNLDMSTSTSLATTTITTTHTAPESVKRVKSSAQILGKMADGGWTPVNIDGVLWWPELPPSAFVALNLQKNDLSTVFVRYFLHVRSSVVSAWNTDKYFKYFFTYEVLPSPSLPFPYPR